MFLFSNDLGVDLGTSNVLIYADGKGLVVREPSVVAMDKNTGKILQVGAAARNMLGRTPGNVVAMHPLKDGTVSDHEMTVRMLQEMFKTATKASFFTPKPRVVISVPSGVSEVEERSVINAAMPAIWTMPSFSGSTGLPRSISRMINTSRPPSSAGIGSRFMTPRLALSRIHILARLTSTIISP